ncbi:MAG: phospholipase D-like domain-containing protein [Acidobacteriota bacterium]
MKLLIQPEDGVGPLIEAMEGAKKSIEIAIFRCDHPEIERTLVEAVKRGVTVQALIAYTNRGGERRLRGLEMRLLAAGAVVARTNNDLARYHGKYIIIDQKKVFLLGFNFTVADLRRTRSFGLISSHHKLVDAVSELFKADTLRQSFATKSRELVVSPVNARERLTHFLSAAKKQLLIYDLKISDPAMLQVLQQLAKDGVEIRVIGRVKGSAGPSDVRGSHPLRLHARVIVRDGDAVFLGSQSLSRLELDMRREVGVLVDDSKIAGRIAKVFEQDWETAKSEIVPAEKVAKKVAKAVAKSIDPIGPVLEQISAKNGALALGNHEDLEEVVRER